MRRAAVIALPPDLGDLNRAVGFGQRTECRPRLNRLQLLGIAHQHDLRARIARCRQDPLHLSRSRQTGLVDHKNVALAE